MILKKMFFPGKFDDAYLYMGWLHLIGEDRKVVSIELQAMSDEMDRQSRGSKGVASYLFARNDWLAGAPFKALMTNRGLRNSFIKAMNALPDVYSDTQSFMHSGGSHSLDLQAGAFVDTKFYGQRMYVGTTRGFFDIEVRWDKDVSFERPRKRLDLHCLSISAKYGAVSASCGDAGLFVFMNELDQHLNHRFAREVARPERSVRTGWSGAELINYGGGSEARSYQCRLERVPTQRFEETNVVTELLGEGNDLLDRVPFPSSDMARRDVRYMFNSNGFLYLQDSAGQLYRAGRTSSPGSARFRPPQKLERTAPVLSATATKVGLVVEYFDSVDLVSTQQVALPLIKNPVLSVRTYMTSKRFQNLATIADEDGVWLISMLEPPGH